MRSTDDRPPPAAIAGFDPAFGRRFVLTVELADPGPPDEPAPAGEPLDWLGPFQQLCQEDGVAPVYLVDRSLARPGPIAEAIGPAIVAGKAAIGILLPAEPATATSPPETAPAGLAEIRDLVERTFGAAPALVRAERACPVAGLAALRRDGIAVDASARPNRDPMPRGPDYRRHPLVPYWLDAERTVLELPLTTVFWGLLRRQGDWLHRTVARGPRARAWLARLALLRRITIAPGSASVEDAIRAIDIALDDGLPLLVLSIAAGSVPGGEAGAPRAAFFDGWRRVFTYLELREVAPATVPEVTRAVRR